MRSKAFFSTFFSAYSIISVHARTCDDKHIIESKPLTTPSGNVITMEIFNCSNTMTAPFRQQLSASSAVDRRHFLDLTSSSPRDAPGHTASNSLCRVPCVFNGCFPKYGIGTLEDCPDLANSLMARDGAFIIPAGLIAAFMSANCIIAAFGSPTEDAEYCFFDMGLATLQLFRLCGLTHLGDCEIRAGDLAGAVSYVHLP